MLATSVVSGALERARSRASARGTTSRPTPTQPDQERREPPDGRSAARRPRARRPARPRSAPPSAGSRSGPRRSGRRPRARAARPRMLLLVERLGDDRRARDRDRSRRRRGSRACVQPNAAPIDEAEPEHHAALDDRGEPGRRRRPATSLRRLNSSPSENMSRITPSSESVCTTAGVGDQRDRHVRADDQPGEHVAEHDRLAQALEEDGRDRGDARARSPSGCRNSCASCIRAR